MKRPQLSARHFFRLLLPAFLLSTGGYVHAQPVQWSTNNHYYQVVTASVSWTQAKLAAEAMLHEGMTGYLATATSADENAFLASLIPSGAKVALIGGSDAAAEGSWTWVTGEPFTFQNWHSGEPNNQGDEDYLYMYGDFFGPAALGMWNDGDNTSVDTGHYIVEWGAHEASTGSVEKAYNVENGHYYLVVSGNVTWAQAVAAASGMLHEGMTGYLATVTSSQENSFVSSILPDQAQGVRLGGTDVATEGTWQWITGEAFSYSAWFTGEPNNQGDEDYLRIMGLGIGPAVFGTWADGHDTPVGITHYLVEWGDYVAETSSVERAYNPENEHYYLVVSANVSWAQARVTAGGMVFNGMTGYLATVTSSQENDFVAGLLPTGTKVAFLGGTDEQIEGVWDWVTGETFGFTNWYAGEPNNENDEDYLYLYGDFWPEGEGTWNDGDSTSVDARHYVVEWGSYSAETNALQKAYNSANGHYYLVVSSSVTWVQAMLEASETECDGMPGYLATLTSSQENAFVAGLLPPGAKAAFIGGTDSEAEGAWAWVTGEAFEFTNWNVGEPNNENDEDYLTVAGDFWPELEGKWNDGDSSSADVKHYVIEWGGFSVDTSEFSHVMNPDNGHYYLVVTANVSWAQARSAAANMLHEGMTGYLATATSSQENSFITGLLPAGTKAAFIGATDESSEGAWRWVTGEAFGFQNWGPGEPNNQSGEDYLYLYGGFFPEVEGRWNDGDATSIDTHHYIVEWGEFDDAGGLPEPTLNPENGHWYLVVENAISWQDAATVAGQSVFMGMTGYLATATSQAENEFIYSLLDVDAINVSIGGTDAGTEGAWRWLTGEAFSYTNWATGEPNNHGGPENYMVMNGPAHSEPYQGTWNDGRGQQHPDNSHYVIEWGDFDGAPPLPEPVLNPENGHYYLVVPANITWLEAVSASLIPFNSMTGYLATITSSQENAFVAGLLPGETKVAFVGGTDAASEGTWQWITGEPFVFTNWYAGEPNNENDEDYLYLYGDFWLEGEGTWNDGDNASVDVQHYVIEWGEYESQPFVLQRAFNPANGHWYMVVSNAVSWNFARLASQIPYENMTGYLATVTSGQENQFIYSLLGEDAINVHLGGTDNEVEGEWKWVTGESFAYTNWGEGEPNNHFGPENFLVMNGPAHSEPYEGKWNDGRGQQHPDNSHYVVEWGYYDSGENQISPVLNPENGHWYLVVSNSVSWWQALHDARIVFSGMTGYLATVTSTSENTFVCGLLGDGTFHTYLGGKRSDDESPWHWVTGESFGYDNFAGGDDDSIDDEKNFVLMRGNEFGIGKGGWEAGYGGQNPRRDTYVIEWGGGLDTLPSILEEEWPDSDGDGVDDDEEEEDGTNPFDSESIFRGHVRVIDGQLYLSWRTVHGRCYRVQQREPGPGSEFEFVSDEICETDEYPEGTELYALTNTPVKVGSYRIIWIDD